MTRIALLDADERAASIESNLSVVAFSVLEIFVEGVFEGEGVDGVFGAEPRAADRSEGSPRGGKLDYEVWSRLIISFMLRLAAALEVDGCFILSALKRFVDDGGRRR